MRRGERNRIGCYSPNVALGWAPSSCASPSSATTVDAVIAEEDGKLWKLLLSEVWQDGWTGPDYPNNTVVVDYNK